MDRTSVSLFEQRANEAESKVKDLTLKLTKINEQSNASDATFEHFRAETLSLLEEIRKELINTENETSRYKEQCFNMKLLNMDCNRSLHWVIKIGNLKESLKFFECIFGMKVLRHEEFSEGCDAKCNGDYSRPWSKTMIGFNDEKFNFAFELTYNYGIFKYRKGNDIKYIGLYCTQAGIDSAKQLGYSVNKLDDNVGVVVTVSDDNKSNNNNNEDSSSGNSVEYSIIGPDEMVYHCKIVDILPKEPVWAVALNVTNLTNTYDYWVGLLGMHCLEFVSKFYLRAGFNGSVALEFYQLRDESLDHGKASGRIAFNTRMGNKGTVTRYNYLKDEKLGSIHTEPITLKTPGKADVNVVILSDPDAFEICFVGEKGFDQLCTTKPGDEVIDWKHREKFGADQNKGKYDK